MTARRPVAMHVRLRAAAVLAATLAVLLGTLVPLLAPAVLAAFATGAVTVLDVAVLGGGAMIALIGGLGLASALPAGQSQGLAWDLAMMSRLPRLSALVYLAGALAVGVATATVAPLLVLAGPGGAVAGGLLLGLLLAQSLLAVAVFLPLGWEDVEASAPVAGEPAEERPDSPLLKFIRESTPYRWQVSSLALLRGREPVLATPDEAAQFEAAWPGALALLAASGVRSPTRDHLDGVAAVLTASEAVLSGGAPSQRPLGSVAVCGLPGSGRTEAVLAAATWVAEIRGGRVLVVTPTGEEVLPGWFSGLVTRQGDHPELLWSVPTGPAGHALPEAAPAVVVTQGRELVESLLPLLAHEQPAWTWSLRLVVVMHPHRFARAEWLHVREALIRLRMLVGARGQDFASAALVHDADNRLALVEHLLARADTREARLDRAAPTQLLVGWLPPTMLSPHDERYIVRTPLAEELAVLLASIGAAGFCGVFGARVRPRVLVSDATGLLSPEAREALSKAVKQVAADWSELFKADPVDLVPRIELSRGFAPAAHGEGFPVIVHAGPGATAGAEIDALRGLLAPGGTLFVVAAPRAHDVEAVSDVEAAAARRRVVVYPPGLSDDLVTARLWQFLERLKPGTCLAGSKMARTHGGEPWADFLAGAPAQGLGGCVQAGVVRDATTGEVRAEPFFVAPATWPRPVAPPMPWSCVTSERLLVQSENAAHDEVGRSAQVDAERGLVDWIATTRVEGEGHSLQVAAIDGGRVGVFTPESSVAASPALYRSVRQLAIGQEALVRTRDFSLPTGLCFRFTRELSRVRETVSGVFSTAHGLNADRRLVGNPVDVPPYTHAFTAASLSIDIRTPSVALSPEASRALLNAWRLDLEAACLGLGEEIDAEMLDGEEGASRWLFFRRFASGEWTELSALHPNSADELRALLARLGKRLRACHCLDGCVLCCARLGDVPVLLTLPRGGRVEPDIEPSAQGFRVSRRAAVDWLVGVGVLPEVKVRDAEERDVNRLDRLRRRILGEPPGWTGGWVTQMFGALQVIPQARVAPITWMTPEECAERLSAGFYRSGPEHEVRVRPHADDDWVAEVIAHEYTHNWQWEGGRFDAGRHRTGSPGNAYYEGKLVIEGHATWVDTQFRMSVGNEPSYRADDGQQWTEYKAGYLVVDWIARTYGVAALYTWLAGHKEPRPVLRLAGAPWPLTLDQAIDRAGVREQIVGAGGESDVL